MSEKCELCGGQIKGTVGCMAAGLVLAAWRGEK